MAEGASPFTEGSPAYASLFGFLGVMGAMVFTGLCKLGAIFLQMTSLKSSSEDFVRTDSMCHQGTFDVIENLDLVVNNQQDNCKAVCWSILLCRTLA